MFQNLQNTLLKKMLKSQGLPEAQVEMLLAMIEKNPELFKVIAKETEERVKSGMSQRDAAMKVMEKYQAELKKLRN
jgi:hypothetical protein